MKMVKIRPRGIPAGVKDADHPWTKADYLNAMKLGVKGVLTVPPVTAMENVRNSKGMYEIIPENEVKDPTLPTMPDVSGMNRMQLFASCATFGITISNRSVPTEKLRGMVQAKMDEFLAADDDDEDDDED